MFSFNFNRAQETKKEAVDSSQKVNRDSNGIISIADAQSAITPKKFNEQGGEPLVIETDDVIIDAPLTSRQNMSQSLHISNKNFVTTGKKSYPQHHSGIFNEASGVKLRRNSDVDGGPVQSLRNQKSGGQSSAFINEMTAR